MSETVREITLKIEVYEKLSAIVKLKNTSESQVVSEAIEKMYEEVKEE